MIRAQLVNVACDAECDEMSCDCPRFAWMTESGHAVHFWHPCEANAALTKAYRMGRQALGRLAQYSQDIGQ